MVAIALCLYVREIDVASLNWVVDVGVVMEEGWRS
jgi:hypothetical protein